MDKKESLQMMNQSCYTMISHSETKISILTAIDVGIIAAAVGTYASNNFFVDFYNFNKCCFIIITSYISLISFGAFISLLICLYALLANFVTSPHDPNPFYYCDVYRMGSKKYLNSISNEEDTIKYLAEENVMLSKIVEKKYKLFNKSLLALLHSFCLGITFVVMRVRE